MSRPLPLRANLGWLKKLAKDRLAAIRTHDPAAKLSDAQRAIAGEYGFRSWRAFKAHVERHRQQLDALVPADVRRRAVADPVAVDDPQLAELFGAIESGQAQTVASLLAERPGLALAHDEAGQTALHLAARYNDPNIAAALVAYGADVNAAFGQSGHTPLSWAVTCNAMDCARALVKLGTEADLFCAAGIGAMESLQAHFDSSGNIRAGAARTGSSRFGADGSRLPCPPPDSMEQLSDALYIACRNGQVDAVRFLLDKRPDLSFRAFLGGTPLHWAHFSGSSEVIELLEQRGADVDARDFTFGCRPRSFGICVAANWGFTFLVRALLAKDPTLVNAMDGSTSPMHEAAMNNRAEVVQLLLDRGADPALANGEGQTALELAEERGHVAIVEILRSARQPETA